MTHPCFPSQEWIIGNYFSNFTNDNKFNNTDYLHFNKIQKKK